MTELAATGMDTNGQLHISGPTDVLRIGGMVSSSGTPTLAAGAALGTSPPAMTIVGNNYTGIITFKTATLSIAAGVVLTLSFADGLTYPNGAVVNFSPGNDNFASAYTALYQDTSMGSTSSVTLRARLGLGLNTTYVGTYTIIGY